MRDPEIHPLRAIFIDKEQERTYQHKESESSVLHVTIAVLVVLVGMLAFVRSDFLFFGYAPLFWELAALRVVYFVAGGVLLLSVWKQKRNRLLTPWAAATFAVVVLINLSRPASYSYNFAADFLYIFFFYAYIPVPLISKSVIAAAFSVAEAAVLLLLRHRVGEVEQNVILFGLIATNLVAFPLARSGEITRRKRYLSQLREAEATAQLSERAAELEASNRALDNFSRAVAHDLKNPLGGIIGIVDLLKDDLQNEFIDREQVAEYISLLDDSTEHLVAIVDSLLLLARLRRHDEPEVAPVDLAASVARVVKRLKCELTESRAVVETAKQLPTVIGYAPWIDEVMANYISNAIKYGGSPPRVVVDAVLIEKGQVRVQVTDNGEGVSDMEKLRVFDEFSRGKQGRLRVDGLGLGLSIAQNVVDRLHGKVGVADAEGGGSRFWFTLPVATDV